MHPQYSSLMGTGISSQPTSTSQRQSCSKPTRVPIRSGCQPEALFTAIEQVLLTGPTRSGIQISNIAILTRINMKPRRVTMFGASHMGSKLTAPFHCSLSIEGLLGKLRNSIHSAVECNRISTIYRHWSIYMT